MANITRCRPNPDLAKRGILRAEVLHWFARPGGEGDPVKPIESHADIVFASRPGIARFERSAGCDHGVVADAEDRTMTLFPGSITEEP